jgi:3-hydroxyacyl-[acyl-carrier-protein] dehydratase
MRWIWIDRFLELNHGKSARALKNLSTAEAFFADHFPGFPVMPGSLILEGLAQTGGILVGEANDFREKVVLAKIPQARFHRDVLVGEQLVYEVEMVHLRAEGALVQGRALVGGVLVAEAEIFFAHLDQARSRQVFGDHNFVFSGELKYILQRAGVLNSRPDSSA